MSPAELQVWWDEHLANPWGELRADLRNALVCMTVANHAGMTRKQPAKLDDFILRFNSDEKPPEIDPAMHFKQFIR